jgi:hypothetical protein
MKRINNMFRSMIMAIAMLAALSSCKKDKETAGPGIAGSWRNVTTQSASPSYYIFTDSRKLYRLSYSNQSYKQTEFAIYKVTGSQISIQDPNGNKLYNFRYAGDTLIFNNGNTDAIKLLKDNLAPQNINDWASPVAVSNTFVDTVGAKTIAYSNNTLYTFKYYSVGSKLVKFNTITQAVSLANADNTYQGLDFASDGTMWCVMWQNAYKFSELTGAYTFKSVDLSSNSLWATAVNGSVLYNYATAKYIGYDITLDDWGYQREVDNDVTDLAYANGFLYVAKAGMIYKMQPYYAAPVQCWYLENYDVQGIAYTGSGFWLAAKNNATDKHEMLKVDLN